jgi:hypothetical protein
MSNDKAQSSNELQNPNDLKEDFDINPFDIDTFDGAKPRFLNRGKKRRSVSTLSIPRASDRGVEWVDLTFGF